MNCVLVYPGEILMPNRAELTGARATYAIATHELTVGINVKAGVLGGQMGRASVLTAQPDRVVLSLALESPPPEKIPTELAIAVPRPQTIKKILQLSASTGVKKVHFLRTDNVVKSYLQSKMLLPDNIEREVLKGLEQGADTIRPEVVIHKGFSGFLEDAGKEAATVRIVADTRESTSIGKNRGLLKSAGQRVLLAIGPESGWSDREMGRLKEAGFVPVSLGKRMLRVETAACFLLAQLDLLREQASC